jgi:hypothetical protein
MRKYSKFIVVGGALLALVVPSAAMADQTAFTYKGGDASAPLTQSQGSEIGFASSQGTHNGTVVSQQAKAGIRSANVQYYLGTDGLGNGTVSTPPAITYAPGSIAS